MGESLDLCSNIQLDKCSLWSYFPKDCISSLPDDILLFILSFLPFKQVVKTSLLSRRWLNLWMHSLVLDFYGPSRRRNVILNDRERQKHIMLVDRVLQQHIGQYLKEFKIVGDLDRFSQKDIDKWLVYALQKKVECLELNLALLYDPYHLEYNYVFPDPFLYFGSGKPNSIGGENQFLWSGLKSFYLKRVNVSGEAINFVLLNCPFLERLVVVGSSTLFHLAISDPTLVLKYLSIRDCSHLKVLSLSNFNLVSLDISAVGDLTLTHLPMLVDFVFDVKNCVSKHCISQASSAFALLEAFTLQRIDLKDAAQLVNYDQLTKLKRLVLTVDDWHDHVTNAISIIHACPRLEEFVFTLNRFETGGRRIPTGEVTPLKSKSLKVFEFVGYEGNATNVEVISLVVESAFNLEKIIINSYGKLLYDDSTRVDSIERMGITSALRRIDKIRKRAPHIHFVIR